MAEEKEYLESVRRDNQEARRGSGEKRKKEETYQK